MPITCWRGRKAGDLPALRYFTDTQLAKLPTQLAKAQLAAALAQSGDVARAARGLRRRARAAADAAGRAPLCRLRQRSARQRRGAGLCRRQSGEAAAPDGGHGPHRRAVRRAPPHQHAGAGLAVDGGRGGGARRAAATMTVATGDAAPQTRDEPLYLRRALGTGAAPVDDRQSRRDAGLAHGVDHRRAEGRPAGREQRLCVSPRGVPAATARRPI